MKCHALLALCITHFSTAPSVVPQGWSFICGTFRGQPVIFSVGQMTLYCFPVSVFKVILKESCAPYDNHKKRNHLHSQHVLFLQSAYCTSGNYQSGS